MISTGGNDIIAGGGGYGGGFGGIAPIGLVGISNLFGRNGYGDGGYAGAGSIPGTTVLEQNVSDLRKDVADGVSEVIASQNEQNIAFLQGVNALDKTLYQTAYAASAQSAAETASTNQLVNASIISADKNTCAILSNATANADRIIAELTAGRISALEEKNRELVRLVDTKGIEIQINNTQSQNQTQIQSLANLLTNYQRDMSSQMNHATQSIVNLGTMFGSGQKSAETNVKS